MGNSYATIAFYPDLCDGCDDCVKACAGKFDEEGSLVHSRIQIAKDENDQFGLALCRQCGEPECVQNCPVGALSKDPDTGVILKDDTCIGCKICTLSCSYAGITANPVTGKVMKCEQCEGEPACVTACGDKAALAFLKNNDIYNTAGQMEDLVAPGISACLGCNTELLFRHSLRKIGSNTVLAIPPGCTAGVGAVGVNGVTATKVPSFHPLLTNTSSMLAGIKRYYDRIGRDITMMAFAGDGGTADVGFQSLSGAAERGERMIYICIDNEGYMNTGVQRSGTTPYGAWTSTTPVGAALKGKTRDAKYLPLIMVMHNCEYVATASTAFMEDFYEKLDKAARAAETGMAYLHVFSPCPTGWRFPPDQLIEVGRKAVKSNLVPLWEYSNETKQLEFTHSVDTPIPVEDFLLKIGKYRHLDSDQLAFIKEIRDRKIEILKNISTS
ncbi:MAG: thiamine pyrophosphate-dependent enzyme [Desulfobacterales bacterium]|nr:thiamine pyrophosphate-dependent enzyme [Desulfobacterales bacterium]